MNRSVGLTLRRTAGGAVLFGLGFGALSAAPQPVVSVTASAAIVPLTTPLPPMDQLAHPQPRPVPILATPGPETIAAPVVSLNAMQAPSREQPPRPQVRRPSTAIPHASTTALRSNPSGGAVFAYGYCTWWVAHKRYVPWHGDAAQWWSNARAFGYSEGATPRVGSIMVMGAGGSAAPQGHVAYVESVNANGSFVVSEMNWWGVPGGGWGRVDYRTVISMRGILGFIY